MARTYKDRPYCVKIEDAGGDFRKAQPSWAERGSGPGGVRMAKREARRARRRGVEHPWMVKSLRTTTAYNCG